MKQKKRSKSKNFKGPLRSQRRPRGAQIKERYPAALGELFTYGEPDRDSDAAQIWASEMGEYVDSLAEIVLDKECNDGEVPTCWASLHALDVLTALAASGPARKLLQLFDLYDEWLNPAAGEYFASLGETGFALLKSYLSDADKAPEKRLYVADAFATLTRQNPSLQADVVSFLCGFLRRPEADDNEAQEELTSSVISALAEIGDEAALPAIKQAFDEDRVATLQFSYEYVEAKIKGIEKTEKEPDDDLVRLPIRCLACQRERHYRFEKVYYDSRYADLDSPHSPLVVPGGFTCSKCGATEQYELSSLGSFSVLTKLMGLEKQQIHADGVATQDADKGIIPMRFVAFGEPMHPAEAMERYEEALQRDPKDDIAHIGYANILAFLGHPKEAVSHYKEALALNPDSYSAMLKMGQVAQEEGQEEAAINWFAKAKEVVERVDLPLGDREEICAALEAEIQSLQEGGEPSETFKKLLLDASGRVQREKNVGLASQRIRKGPMMVPAPFARSEAKVKPNDRCPCGSGKKYKKCCM